VFVQSFDELNLPPVLADIADEERGLIIVTGTTGSGKSTTLAAMIDWINARKARHIVTIEDPVEYVQHDKRSTIAQREVGRDTPSFHEALRYVLRQDPDVILIGEMRDEETVRTALTAAQTGHLVLSTLHTLDAPETINRIIDFFPPHTQNQVRSMLAGTLRAIISQRLVPTSDGLGRVPACEILRGSARVQSMLLDPTELMNLHDAIADGSYYGMQTFDQALLHWVQEGKVSLDDALPLSSRPHDFRLLLESGGERAGSLAHVEYFSESATEQAGPRQ
jgi:twitching motility protein PilT